MTTLTRLFLLFPLGFLGALVVNTKVQAATLTELNVGSTITSGQDFVSTAATTNPQSVGVGSVTAPLNVGTGNQRFNSFFTTTNTADDFYGRLGAQDNGTNSSGPFTLSITSKTFDFSGSQSNGAVSFEFLYALDSTNSSPIADTFSVALLNGSNVAATIFQMTNNGASSSPAGGSVSFTPGGTGNISNGTVTINFASLSGLLGSSATSTAYALRFQLVEATGAPNTIAGFDDVIIQSTPVPVPPATAGLLAFAALGGWQLRKGQRSGLADQSQDAQ